MHGHACTHNTHSHACAQGMDAAGLNVLDFVDVGIECTLRQLLEHGWVCASSTTACVLHLPRPACRRALAARLQALWCGLGAGRYRRLSPAARISGCALALTGSLCLPSNYITFPFLLLPGTSMPTLIRCVHELAC